MTNSQTAHQKKKETDLLQQDASTWERWIRGIGFGVYILAALGILFYSVAFKKIGWNWADLRPFVIGIIAVAVVLFVISYGQNSLKTARISPIAKKILATTTLSLFVLVIAAVVVWVVTFILRDAALITKVNLGEIPAMESGNSGKGQPLAKLHELIANLHPSKSAAEQQISKITLVGIGEPAVPVLTASLSDPEMYPNAVFILRDIGEPSVRYIHWCLSQDRFERQVLLQALGDIGLARPDTIAVLRENLPQRGALPRPGRREVHPTTAFVSLLKLKPRVELEKISNFPIELNQVDFKQRGIADIGGLNFSGIRVANLKMSGISGVDLHFENSQIGGDFVGSIIPDAKFKEATLTRVNFTGAGLMNANFARATLEDVNFDAANLTGAIFRGARMKQTSFQDANLAYADFLGAKFNPDELQGAKGLPLAINLPKK